MIKDNLFDSLSEKTKKIMYQFRYDCFFHYLLKYDDELRLFLCRYLSQDDSIRSTTIESSETYSEIFNGKTLVLDILCRDDQGRYYNFEMQNGDIDENELIRFNNYLYRIIEHQQKKGKDYTHIENVYQLIFYTGNRIKGMNGYRNDIHKMIRQTQKQYTGDQTYSILLQLRQLEEELKMDQALQPLEQISYILLHDRKHEKSEATPLIDGIIEMHENYLRDEKEFIKAIEMERERLVYNTRLKVAEEKGKEEGIEVGLKQGKIESAKTITQSIYTEEDLNWIEECQEEQLDKIFTYIMQNLDYDVFKQKVLGKEKY